MWLTYFVWRAVELCVNKFPLPTKGIRRRHAESLITYFLDNREIENCIFIYSGKNNNYVFTFLPVKLIPHCHHECFWWYHTEMKNCWKNIIRKKWKKGENFEKVSFKILFWTGFGFDGKFNFTNFSKKWWEVPFFQFLLRCVY